MFLHLSHWYPLELVCIWKRLQMLSSRIHGSALLSSQEPWLSYHCLVVLISLSDSFIRSLCSHPRNCNRGFARACLLFARSHREYIFHDDCLLARTSEFDKGVCTTTQVIIRRYEEACSTSIRSICKKEDSFLSEQALLSSLMCVKRQDISSLSFC